MPKHIHIHVGKTKDADALTEIDRKATVLVTLGKKLQDAISEEEKTKASSVLDDIIRVATEARRYLPAFPNNKPGR